MAKTRFDFYFSDLEKTQQAIHHSSLDLKGKGECLSLVDVLRAWKNFLSIKYDSKGILLHHSNPDDPPDFILCFTQHKITVEHTKFQPSPLGWSEAITKGKWTTEDFPMTRIPALSETKPQTGEDLEESLAISLTSPQYTDDHAEGNAERTEALKCVMKKIERTAAQWIVIQNMVRGLDFEDVSIHLNAEIQKLKIPSRKIFFHNQPSPSKHSSVILEYAQEIKWNRVSYKPNFASFEDLRASLREKNLSDKRE